MDDKTNREKETIEENKDKKVEIPKIAERIKFWEEQDRINKAIIPRVLKNHDLLEDLSKNVSSFSVIVAKNETKVKEIENNVLLKTKFGFYFSLLALLMAIVSLILSIIR